MQYLDCFIIINIYQLHWSAFNRFASFKPHFSVLIIEIGKLVEMEDDWCKWFRYVKKTSHIWCELTYTDCPSLSVDNEINLVLYRSCSFNIGKARSWKETLALILLQENRSLPIDVQICFASKRSIEPSQLFH